MPRSRASNTPSPMYLSRGAHTILRNFAVDPPAWRKSEHFRLGYFAETEGFSRGRGFLRGGRILRSN